MNQPAAPQPTDPHQAWGWVSYGLHLIVAVAAVLPGAQPGVGLLFIAWLLDRILHKEVQGSWLASHCRWRLKTVLWAGLAYLVTLPLWLFLVFPGMLAWDLISLWFLYRIVLGMVRMNRQQAMEFPDVG